ncbi:MAG: protein phosphatase 2C domain-containing protein [Eubacteriales bacterium]|nr:protein phosphatase 2C domain-containing protein [Eubacteriales bacterium]
MVIFGTTDIGRQRTANQDSFLARELCPGLVLLCVCDGMGGAVGGAEASSLAVRAFSAAAASFAEQHFDSEEGCFTVPAEKVGQALAAAAREANRSVHATAAARPELHGMGTTLAAALVTHDLLYGVNVGDSRVYLCTADGTLRRLSRDHSYVQYLVDMGEISEDEAKYNERRNIITRAIGVEEEVEPDTFTAVAQHSRVLICSDGLTAHLDDSAIAKILSDFTMTLEDGLLTLVTLANEAGGTDNITAAAAETDAERATGSEE